MDVQPCRHFSDVLTAGAKMRALIYGRDPEALAFLEATESVGLHLDYTQNLGENRIGCISTAFRAFQRVGRESYTEALSILTEAWQGEPHSLRGETVRAMIEFVDLYKGEFSLGLEVELGLDAEHKPTSCQCVRSCAHQTGEPGSV